MHRAAPELQPHGPLHAVTQACTLQGSVAPADGATVGLQMPCPASAAVVRPPATHVLDLELQPQLPVQSLEQKVMLQRAPVQPGPI